MKKLSDYKGDEAIELWADLIDPLSEILTDEEVRDVVQSGESKIKIAQVILKSHSQQASDILLRIDDTPIDGLNILLRLVALLADIGQNEDIKGFFGYAEQEKKDEEPSGSPMANTEAEEK